MPHRKCQITRSDIGKYAPRAILRTGDILIATSIYVDGSGKTHDGFMTVAMCAADDDYWGVFESGWKDLLDSNDPKAAYIHLREMMGGDREFSWRNGWNLNACLGLVMRSVSYLSKLDKSRIKMFYCSIDLEAWRRLSAQGCQMLTPIQLANEFCVGVPQAWHMRAYQGTEVFQLGSGGSPDGTYFIFDRGEEFTAPFRDEWNHGLDRLYERGEKSPWILINSITEADSRGVYGLQAADVLAWSVNREATASAGLPGTFLSEILRTVVPLTYKHWDEDSLRKRFGCPPARSR